MILYNEISLWIDFHGFILYNNKEELEIEQKKTSEEQKYKWLKHWPKLKQQGQQKEKRKKRD